MKSRYVEDRGEQATTARMEWSFDRGEDISEEAARQLIADLRHVVSLHAATLVVQAATKYSTTASEIAGEILVTNNLTQREFAKLLGGAQGQISSWVLGHVAEMAPKSRAKILKLHKQQKIIVPEKIILLLTRDD